MSIYYAPNTPMGKELWKWDHSVNEQHPDDRTIRGMRPAVFQEFPKMVYRGSAHGGSKTQDYRLALTADHERQLRAEGFTASPLEAVSSAERQQTEIAKLAAERHYHERHMSEPARREVEAHEAETSEHLPVIPETPITRRGRPRKTEQVS